MHILSQLKAEFGERGLTLELSLVGVLVLVTIVVVSVVLVKARFSGRLKHYEVDEAEIGLGNQKIKIRPNFEDLQVAYNLWTELSTRKLGLPIDEDNDVIVELYDSWCEFFKIARELIKNIPVSRVRSAAGTKSLVQLSVDLLNKGIRPHLTRWQARFRHWYDRQREEDKSKEPQLLQREYPEYEALMADLKNVNNRLVSYCRMLNGLVHDT